MLGALLGALLGELLGALDGELLGALVGAFVGAQQLHNRRLLVPDGATQQAYGRVDGSG